MAGDYGDYEPPRELSGMDKMFTSYMVLMVILAICCNGIGLILGIVGLVACKDEGARRNALIVTIIAGVITAIGIVVAVVNNANMH